MPVNKLRLMKAAFELVKTLDQTRILRQSGFGLTTADMDHVRRAIADFVSAKKTYGTGLRG